jgi:hypothetical protein
MQTARVIKEYSWVLEWIERGEIHLVGVALLAPVLTPSNTKELFEKARRKSKREIERLISELSVAMVAPAGDLIRRLPVTPAPKVEPVRTLTGGGNVENSAPRVDNFPPPAPPTPIPRRVSIHFLADEEFLKCLERARGLMKHKYPEGRLEDVFHEALRLYLEKKDPELKLPAKPFTEISATRHIPTADKNFVWKRDGGRCTFQSADGKRCEARAGLEFDHIIPWSQGGLSNARNLRLLCRAHNQYEARRRFGDEWIERKIKEVAKTTTAE